MRPPRWRPLRATRAPEPVATESREDDDDGKFFTAGHLGGYILGGDAATDYPDLWRWLVTDHGVRSMVDVGCGESRAVEFFRSLGVEAVGIDGVPEAHPDIVHDYTQGPYDIPGGVDLVWSCEFVEHVEERYVPHFLSTFTCAPLVLMSHAEPGQPGYHHVNCRTQDYWQGVMAAVGYVLDEELTEASRAMAGPDDSAWWNHFWRSGLAFRRRP